MQKICSYDIIFLHETWTDEHSDVDIDGYVSFHHYRKFQNKRAKRYSGGSIVYVRNEIYKGVQMVKNHYDTILWLKLDKHFFQMENDIYLAGVYIWVENSPAYEIVDGDFLDLLQNDICSFLTLGSVLMSGDWNARTGSRLDYIVCDRNIDFLDDPDYLADTPLLRATDDNICNSYGLRLIDLCKATTMRIANGRLGSGSCTYTTRNGSSVIDYLVLK